MVDRLIPEKLSGEAASTDTVTVACKMPNGLEIHLDKEIETDEPLLAGGYKKVKTYVPEEFVRLNGFSVPLGIQRETLVNGYGLTFDVSARFMERWLKANANSPLVNNGIVFVHKQAASARDKAVDMGQRVKSGLEPLDPKGDYRDPKPMSVSLSRLTQEEEQATRDASRSRREAT